MLRRCASLHGRQPLPAPLAVNGPAAISALLRFSKQLWANSTISTLLDVSSFRAIIGVRCPAQDQCQVE